jgi:hypothetical protein
MQLLKKTLLLALLSLPTFLLAQNDTDEEFAIRFKTGLNFSKILGPSESINGEDLEDFSFRTGFHVTGGVDYIISEIWGLRAMIGYAQKGTEYEFDGPSFWIFYAQANGAPLPSEGGNRRVVLNTNNSFIELPLSAFARFGRVEIEAGATVGYLIASKSTGELTYSNLSADIDPFTIGLDYDYRNDAFGFPDDPGEELIRRVNGINGTVPTTLGGYYESLGNEERKFNPIDLSLQLNVSFFLNRGLFLGIGAHYSLLDVTNDQHNFSQTTLSDDGTLQPITDQNDHYLILQSSIGFRF